MRGVGHWGGGALLSGVGFFIESVISQKGMFRERAGERASWRRTALRDLAWKATTFHHKASPDPSLLGTCFGAEHKEHEEQSPSKKTPPKGCGGCLKTDEREDCLLAWGGLAKGLYLVTYLPAPLRRQKTDFCVFALLKGLGY